jgi:MtN3 and saliva related transmembrane protein
MAEGIRFAHNRADRMDFTAIIGIIASVGTGTSMLPQLVKMIRDKQANDISLAMLAVLCIGLCFGIYYGALKNDWIIMVSNGFSLLVSLSIGILTLTYKNQPILK